MVLQRAVVGFGVNGSSEKERDGDNRELSENQFLGGFGAACVARSVRDSDDFFRGA